MVHGSIVANRIEVVVPPSNKPPRNRKPSPTTTRWRAKAQKSELMAEIRLLYRSYEARDPGNGWYKLAQSLEMNQATTQRILGCTNIAKPTAGRTLGTIEALLRGMGYCMKIIPDNPVLIAAIERLVDEHENSLDPENSQNGGGGVNGSFAHSGYCPRVYWASGHAPHPFRARNAKASI